MALPEADRLIAKAANRAEIGQQRYPALYSTAEQCISPLPYITELIRHSLMGAQAAGEVHRSRGGHYDVYQGGQSFDDVIQVELHRHTKKAD